MVAVCSMTISAGHRPTSHDEAFEPDGSPRPGYRPLIESLAQTGCREARRKLDHSVAALDVTFGDEGEHFRVDPLPRLIDQYEWRRIRSGLEQRLEALNRFLEDAYGERAVVDDGVMPARVLDESRYLEPLLETRETPVNAAIAGPDLIRDPSGELLVLEDNLRTPSGIAYAIACRNAIRESRIFPDTPDLDVPTMVSQLKDALRSADPSGGGDPSIVLLSDGPESKAWFEHEDLSRRLCVPVVSSGDLELDHGRLCARTARGRIDVQVLYNRSSEESLRRPDGRLSALGDLLAEPLKQETLSCVNSFGAGVADDKAVHCYVEEMIRFYLGEPPILRSVPGFDLGDPEQREEAMDRLDGLVVKPRWSFGGQGIVLGPEASETELDETRSRIEESPCDYVAQPTVDFSVHPTCAGDRTEPRHVDLRAFVISTGGASRALPLALTRFAGQPGEMIVNSTQGGGAKDTWLSTGPDPDFEEIAA